MKNTHHILAGLFFLSLLASCKVDPKIVAPLPSNDLEEVIPEGFPKPVYTFTGNPVKENTFILGRELFYDPILSKDNSTSCASCHQSFAAFANDGHRVSHGINGIEGTRNSPALFNLTWAPYFMHDAAIPNIELQPIAPIQNPIEMGENIVTVLEKLRASQKYRGLFKNAYGSDEINSQKMFKSMAQFMALMYSYNSKYDHYKRKEAGGEMSEAELRGYQLFLANCNSCHTEPLFTDHKLRNNGLKLAARADSGRAHITRQPEDLYRFKTPSLRNIAVTGPYMHDGRYQTLDDCLNHYGNGIVNLVNLDPLLKNGIKLSAQEKSDIIAFLGTLTDYRFLNDKRFANPNFN